MYIHVQSLDREDRRIEERVSKAQVPISQLPGRPKNWRTKCVDILESSISNRYCHNAIMYYGPIVLFDTLPTKFEIVNVITLHAWVQIFSRGLIFIAFYFVAVKIREGFSK